MLYIDGSGEVEPAAAAEGGASSGLSWDDGDDILAGVAEWLQTQGDSVIGGGATGSNRDGRTRRSAGVEHFGNGRRPVRVINTDETDLATGDKRLLKAGSVDLR